MFHSDSPVRQLMSVLLFAAIWHLCVFYLGTKCSTEKFSMKKKRYQALAWEKDGKWYQKHLKIKSWKDKLPQRVPDDGFSKEHLDTVTPEYLDEFIMETCRGEWIHFSNFLLAFAILLIVPHPFKIPFALAVMILHLPYIIIQRYNRFRLARCRERLVRQQQSAACANPAEQAV